MKRLSYILIMLVGLTCFSSRVRAQTWDEWFSQGWAQHEYDRQQIGVLWSFLNTVSDGWKIVGDGLTTVSNITNGELNLHRDFFDKRKNVSPEVTNTVNLIEWTAFQLAMVRQMNEVYQRCTLSSNFSARELLYIERVHRNFLIITEANINELIRLVSPSDVSMSDDERLEHIRRLDSEMRDQRAFVNVFSAETQMLSRQRQHELNETGFLKSHYETF